MYKKMYLLLFNRITDALDALGDRDPAKAAEILRAAQIDAEEIFLETDGN